MSDTNQARCRRCGEPMDARGRHCPACGAAVHGAAVRGCLAALAIVAGWLAGREDLTERSKVAGNVRTIDVQVTRLRRKIEPDPREPRFLHTVRGEGYVLRPEG